MNKIREQLVQEFLSALKEDTIPWEQGWASTGMPQNAVSAAPYHGLNAVILSVEAHKRGYEDSRWCTYKQAKNQGWQVLRGEKGCQIEFWSMYDTKNKVKLKPQDVKRLQETLSPEEYMDRVKPLASYYTVFNAQQMQGIPKVTAINAISNMEESALIQRRDTLLKNMNLDFISGGDRAFYSSGKDRITMPEIGQFKNVYAYMSTLLHEAGHATGHESRLNRDIKNAFGTENYAREELRAEIASAFVSQSIGMENERQYVDNHRAYIQDWIEVLEKNPEELFKAIKDAERIADYLIEKGEFPRVEMEQVREEVVHAETASPGVEEPVDSEKTLSDKDALLLNGEIEPYVTIVWSEYGPPLEDGVEMPFSQANALFEKLDDRVNWDDMHKNGMAYYKTKFQITYEQNGEICKGEYRQDLGDGYGSIVDFLQKEYRGNSRLTKYLETNCFYQNVIDRYGELSSEAKYYVAGLRRDIRRYCLEWGWEDMKLPSASKVELMLDAYKHKGFIMLFTEQEAAQIRVEIKKQQRTNCPAEDGKISQNQKMKTAVQLGLEVEKYKNAGLTVEQILKYKVPAILKKVREQGITISSEKACNLICSTYASDLEEYRSLRECVKASFKERHQQIRADIRANGFKATRTLVNAIERLDALNGKANTLQDIKELAKSQNISADAKEAVNDIVETLQHQETKMQVPEPPAVEPA